jgi:hypothetical protein
VCKGVVLFLWYKICGEFGELAAACEVWKEITFNFPTIDKLDGQE